jgi:hypothetical protein
VSSIGTASLGSFEIALQSSVFDFRVSNFGFRVLLRLLACLALSTCCLLPAQDKLLYENNFEKAEVGKVPDDFLVLDGGFVVKEEEGNRFLELPGAPLETYAVQFGPARSNDVAVSAAIRGTTKGRRFPVFGVGLGGVAGYKLQVSPAKQALEIYRDADLKASVQYQWKSGGWLKLRLQIHSRDKETWLVEGSAWEQGAPEPKQWMISFEAKEEPLVGRASVFSSPFSGEPVRFDNLVVTEAGKE